MQLGSKVKRGEATAIISNLRGQLYLLGVERPHMLATTRIIGYRNLDVSLHLEKDRALLYVSRVSASVR